MPAASSCKDTVELFAQIVTENRLLTEDQSQQCLVKWAELKENGSGTPIEDVAQGLGLLTRSQCVGVCRAVRYLSGRREDIHLAQYLAQQGLVDPTDILYALTLQEALYRGDKGREVPRMLQILVEEHALRSRDLPPLLTTLERIREQLRTGNRGAARRPAGTASPSDTAHLSATPCEATPESHARSATAAEDAAAAAASAVPAPRASSDHAGAAAECGTPVRQERRESVSELSELFRSKLGLSSSGGFSSLLEPTQPACRPSAPAADDILAGFLSTPDLSRANFSSNSDVQIVRPAPLTSGASHETDHSDAPCPSVAPETSPDDAARDDEESDPAGAVASPGTVSRKRRWLRIEGATVHFADKGFLASVDLLGPPADLLKIGTSGLAMLTRQPFALGDRLRLVIHIPGVEDDLDARAEVHSCTALDKLTQRFRIGVRFVKLDDQARERILRLSSDPELRCAGSAIQG